MQKLLAVIALLFLFSISLKAQKAEVYNSKGKAISGYDAVAYFMESKPVEGKAEFTYSWNSANWYFSNAKNLQAFTENPQKYAPQYGGYCAYGMADGHKAPTDPGAWTILDGKLYLNYNKDVQKLWNKKQLSYVASADKNWPGLKNKE